MGEKPNTNAGFILKKHVQSYKVKKNPILTLIFKTDTVT
jgi:hypothetical protein